jgi:hypothetical protein
VNKRAQFRSAEKTTSEWRGKSDWNETISIDSIFKDTHYCYEPHSAAILNNMLYLRNICCIPGFRRSWREFEKDGAFHRTGLEAFSALKAQVEDDDGLSLMHADDIGGTGPRTGATPRAPVGIDPRIESHVTAP